MNLKNVRNLGVKELRGLWRDWIMLALIVYSFSLSVWTSANSSPETLSNAAISIVDEDQSQLSSRIVSAFYQPYFVPPNLITAAEIDTRMDAGLDTFALNIPPDFQRDVLAGKAPAIQLNIDATRMSKAMSVRSCPARSRNLSRGIGRKARCPSNWPFAPAITRRLIPAGSGPSTALSSRSPCCR